MSDITNSVGFGPALFGAVLSIDAQVEKLVPGAVTAVDCETAEDNPASFVGAALTQNGIDVVYVTDLSLVKEILTNSPLIGHSLKGDMKWLIGWGINLKPEQLFYDTALASYVLNTTKESHGLKDLAKELLGMSWPTYKEMVGVGKAKQTLDKQPVERVAAYCGTDCLATYRLWQYFQRKLTPQQKRYLEQIELPTARVLMEMELKGIKVDVDYLQQLDKQFGDRLNEIEKGIEQHWHKEEALNINSNRQIAELLGAQGAVLPLTPKGAKKVDKATLSQWEHLPVVPLLQEYSKIEKLKSTYTEGLLERQKNGRVHCSYNQISKDAKGNSVGISTGRLSSSSPNLQNIPARTKEGLQIRKAFIAPDGQVLIDADFSQIEPRLVAHFSRDPIFLRAFLEGRDIYTDLVEGIPLPHCKSDKERRTAGKTFMLALLYGAQPKKLASIFQCSEEEAERIVADIMRKLPGVTAWINRTKYEAKMKKGVYTLYKRWIPLPKINDPDRYERMHWERVAVNSVIQGSAAEVMKLTLIELHKNKLTPVAVIHDENLIEHINSDASNTVKQIMESIVKLEVPIIAEVGVGRTWGDAKA